MHGSANDTATVVLAISETSPVERCQVKITYRVCLNRIQRPAQVSVFDCSIAGGTCFRSDNVCPCVDILGAEDVLLSWLGVDTGRSLGYQVADLGRPVYSLTTM